MYGWRGSIPSSEWYGEEHAAYLRDGRPKSKADIARIMGTVGNEREYSGNGLRIPVETQAFLKIANMRPRLPPKKAQVYAGTLGGQHG